MKYRIELWAYVMNVLSITDDIYLGSIIMVGTWSGMDNGGARQPFH